MGICKFSSQSGVYRRVKRLGALARAVAGLGLVISILIVPGALTAYAYTNQEQALSLEDAMVQQARNGRWLQKQIAKAKRGDVVSIPAGTYNVQDLKIFKTIKLVGQGEVVLQSLNPVSKGLLVPDLGVSLHVENITFRGARARDRNGAGIRHDGKDLWVINCVFDSNEDGILATGSEDGRLEIRNSTFVNNGHGDGFSHGIYLSSGAQMLVYDSRFLGTKIGHHIKSLAQVTAVTG
ncbi:MAG: right-handed parallel beta-helix repeat-containing protein, partial [Pseudomonadota bacterium]